MRPDIEKLSALWVRWSRDPDLSRDLRFGQFVFNETLFETDRSYNERDPHAAFNSILYEPERVPLDRANAA